MLLVLEVGNTSTKIGVFDGARLLVSGRLTSRREQTADEYGVFTETLLRVRPSAAIGRNTVTNIQSGVIDDYAGLVDGLVERMRREMEGPPRVVATGGHAGLIAEATRSIEIVNPDLTLEGLRMLFERAEQARGNG